MHTVCGRSGTAHRMVAPTKTTGTPRCREDDYATQRGGGSTHSVPLATWSGTGAFLVRRRGHVLDIYFPSSATLRVDNIKQLLKSILLLE